MYYREGVPKGTGKGHISVSLGGGCGCTRDDKQGSFSCWDLMVLFWSLISDPCYMNSSQLEFIAPHWFRLAPVPHCSCLYLLEVWCILKQNEPNFLHCLCQCLELGKSNSFTASLLKNAVPPKYVERPKGATDQNWGRFWKPETHFKGQIFHHLLCFWTPSTSKQVEKLSVNSYIWQGDWKI